MPWCFALFFLVVCSCQFLPGTHPGVSVSLVAWNVQNLFDEVKDGDEYPEFDPDRGWTRGNFWSRCERLAQVIRQIDGGPDILVLEEIENSHTAQVLSERFLADCGYRDRFQASDDVSGVKTVILSRFPVQRTGLLFPVDELRPLVEVEVSLDGRPLIVIANHWKSRIPSPEGTEALRRESSIVLSRRLKQLDARSDGPVVVAVGDFNTSLELSRPWKAKSMVSGLSASPDETALVVYGRRDSCPKPAPLGAVWDPWETVLQPEGSYWYHQDWSRLDHIFLTVASLGRGDWRFGSFSVVQTGAVPDAWSVTHREGVSDHFPVVLRLERQ